MWDPPVSCLLRRRCSAGPLPYPTACGARFANRSRSRESICLMPCGPRCQAFLPARVCWICCHGTAIPGISPSNSSMPLQPFGPSCALADFLDTGPIRTHTSHSRAEEAYNPQGTREIGERSEGHRFGDLFNDAMWARESC